MLIPILSAIVGALFGFVSATVKYGSIVLSVCKELEEKEREELSKGIKTVREVCGNCKGEGKVGSTRDWYTCKRCDGDGTIDRMVENNNKC